jgi:predicted DsbA family dithiol-disulfide isomerase
MVHTDRLIEEYEIRVRWLAFPLHPEIPQEGVTLEEMFVGRNIDVAGIRQRLQQVADSLSLPLAAQTMAYNTRLALELAKWAESQGKGTEFHHAAFHAYFGEGRNTGNVDELAELAGASGLSAKEARSVIQSRSFKDAVDADWERSRALGVHAVPAFMAGGRSLAGFHPYEALEQLVRDAGAQKKQ